jgi:hypothetical protein
MHRCKGLSQSFHAIPPTVAGHNCPDAQQRLLQELHVTNSRIAVSAAAVVSATVLIGAGAFGNRVHAQTDATSIVGAWTLNKDLSQAPQDRAEGDDGTRRGGGYGRGGGGGGRRRGGGFGGGGFGGGGGGGGARGNPDDMARQRQALRDIMEAPERLTITQTESMVIMTTGDGRTTRLSTDGKKVKDDSTKIERKTKWDGGKLVSEIAGAGRGKITETYSVDPEHHQLIVAVQMENSRMPQGTQGPRRVYDADPR